MKPVLTPYQSVYPPHLLCQEATEMSPMTQGVYAEPEAELKLLVCRTEKL